MIVVSDTTAISNLVQIGELELLYKLYGRVVIPTHVFQELQVLVREDTHFKKEFSQNWIRVKNVSNAVKVEQLLETLDLGEAEAITLALELSADYLLIDEKAGRQLAAAEKIRVIGTLGILLDAKKKGHIVSVRDKMDMLRKIGFWISNSLYLKIIELENEI